MGSRGNKMLATTTYVGLGMQSQKLFDRTKVHSSSTKIEIFKDASDTISRHAAKIIPGA